MFTQFIFRFEVGDAYLGAVSRFMTNAFEYGDALLPQSKEKPPVDGQEKSSRDVSPTPHAEEIRSHNQPYLNLPTCVFVVIASHHSC